MTKRGCIYFIEKDVHGVWVIYGTIGIRQYYYYTKAQAIRKYKAEYAKTIVTESKA